MKYHVTRYLYILFGCLLVAFGINLFLLPAHILSGGLSGVALIFHYLFGWPIGLQIFLINIPLLIASYKLLGKIYTVDVVIGTFLVSACIDGTAFLEAYNNLNDPMLSAIFGGIICGIGFGIVFRANGNTGGVDVIGVIAKKYYDMNIGTAIFAVNCLITLAGMLLFGLKAALFTLIGIYLTGALTDRVIAGFNLKKKVIIISPYSHEIAEQIMATMTRGITFIKSEGAFTRQEKDMILTVVNLTQIGKIKQIVNRLDPSAFIIISDANEVMGRGFTLNPFATDAEIKKRAK